VIIPDWLMSVALLVWWQALRAEIHLQYKARVSRLSAFGTQDLFTPWA